MYRPPQNTNIVKSIKSKFENIENNNPPERNNFRKNGHWNHLNNSPRKTEGRPVLQKQISDPLKRNIKRTPAFRLDKSVDSNSEFQRNSFKRNTLFENKVKQFSAVKQNCDTNDKSENRSSIVKDVVKKVPHSSNSIKPVLVKSKSSHDFQYIKSKFNKYCSNNLCKNADVFRNTCSCNEDLSGVDLSLLYTEPVPKALRYKNANGTEMPVNITFPFEPKSESIYNSSTLKLTDKFEAQSLSNLRNDSSLTDTLKTALTKPLPPGPAPQKPPRTFQHSKSEQTEDMVKNISFLHVTNFPEHKVHTKPKSAPKKEKADPKYMLNKLETALRNNKLRARKQARVDISTTSGEDSDDSLLFQSKSNRTLPKLPVQASDYCNNASAFNLNCLNALSCSVANYEKIKEPNSSFFVARPKEEPVYCEPFHYRKDSPESPVTKREGSTRSARSTRNSLYYMSTPVLSGEGIMSDNGIPDKQVPTTKQEWENIAKGFNDRWQFVGCCGALDGKHVNIVCPKNSHTDFYNYKGYFSIVSFALMDSNYRFIYIDVGSNGRVNDATIFRNASLKRGIQNGTLNFPSWGVIAADDAFPLKTYIMKPYCRQVTLSVEKRIFNYRLSRARRIVENAFGILAMRFRIFRAPIPLSPNKVDLVVKATCALHNWLVNSSPTSYISPVVDRELRNGQVIQGAWRQEEISLGLSTAQIKHGSNNFSQQAEAIRGNIWTTLIQKALYHGSGTAYSK